MKNPNELMAITLHQPWASLIAEGKKHYETRSWGTNYRGLIAIHAAKKLHDDESLISLLEVDKSEVPLGAIVAIAELTDCVLMTEEFIIKQSSIEQYLGLWEPGRYAWKLENVRAIEPVSAVGKQGLWKWCSDSWNPADFGELQHKSEENGQLNLLEWVDEEPPDPDDYEIKLSFSFKMQLSTYQQQILEAFALRLDEPTPPKGILIEALAGTGKSFILVEACQQLAADRGITPREIRLVVFGRKNKADLAAKLGEKVGTEWEQSVSTLHALSFQIMRDALRKPNSAFKISSNKYREIAQQKGYIAKKGFGKTIQGNLWSHATDEEINYESWDKDFLKLLELLRLYCFDPNLKDLRDQIFQLIELHKLEFPTDEDTINAVAGAAIDCLYDGYLAINQLRLDYTDMSWGVWQHRHDWKNTIDSYKKQFKFLAVDECQDTDLLQLNLLSLLIDPSHNFLMAVGDKRQAVYAFRGCVSDGMDKFKEYFNCESFLLPINYRCGKLHLQLVREVFPDIPIEAHENAIEGEIKIVRSDNFLQLFDDPTKSYMGVCRKNAPLIGCAIKLLAAGKPAKIKDKSLGGKVVNQIEKICKSQRCKYDVNIFLQIVSDYESAELLRLAKYNDDKNEQKLSDLCDLLQAIITLFEAYEPQEISDWQSLIDKIFDESDYKDAINLYSIHSGKGGEADVAFIIAPEVMPMRHKNQSEAEAEQEKNLLYVALTRPKKTLAIITDEPAKISWLPRKYYEDKTVEITHEPLENDEIETLQELEAAEEDNLAMPDGENQEKQLAEILEKLENLPRPKLRTILRELVDRLGKESIADLMS